MFQCGWLYIHIKYANKIEISRSRSRSIERKVNNIEDIEEENQHI